MKNKNKSIFTLKRIGIVFVALVLVIFIHKVFLSPQISAPAPSLIQFPLIIQSIIETPKKYLIFIPAFGPNNQYRGLKEMMVAAHVLNRTFVLPSFVAHHVKGMAGLRPFNTTFQTPPISQFVNTISIEEFKQECNAEIEKLMWVRKMEGWWHSELDNYLKITGISIREMVPADDSDLKNENTKQMAFSEPADLEKWLKRKNGFNVRCLGIAFPFRSFDGVLGGTKQYLGKAAAVIERAEYIKDLAKKALEEIDTKKEALLAMHWRWGEQTCMAEDKLLHQGYDFCWGTSVYFWAKSSELVAALKKYMEQKQLTRVYLATDSKDVDLMKKLSGSLPISTAKDVPTLRNISDNYILSLVEQEICTMSQLFIASWGSTWSEYIENYWQVTGRDVRASFMAMDRLLNENGYKWISHDFWSYVLTVPPLPPKRGEQEWENPVLGDYVGCFDDTYPRMFFTDAMNDNSMTNDKCAESCGRQKFPYAGTQYSKECFCGSEILEGRKKPDSDCNMPCAGNKNQTCGGFARNSIHRIKEKLQ